ncbi:flagellar protein FliS [Capsulimonas corticalis]|uniref:Flagellar secretion chaperone FliS n=1 Tax=Capsulimonas corticalis TaxID=2219043 RepID=A0A402CSC2_9BACT|nr:flagellar export chaperone FliS [Capsulimonas corticalis]BDI31132.1 flagellar protein FliS [Capsulimonas corticalis]
MSLSSPYNQYQRTAVETANPTRLVIMLYDGAIRFLNQVIPAIQAKDYEKKGIYIVKAQMIVAHLQNTLDHTAGGSVAKSLDNIYTRMYHTLTEANLQDAPAKIEEVIYALRELREAWVEVDRQCQASKAPASITTETRSQDVSLRRIAA